MSWRELTIEERRRLKTTEFYSNETNEDNIEIPAMQKKIVNERLQQMNNNPTDCKSKSWEEINYKKQYDR